MSECPACSRLFVSEAAFLAHISQTSNPACKRVYNKLFDLVRAQYLDVPDSDHSSSPDSPLSESSDESAEVPRARDYEEALEAARDFFGDDYALGDLPGLGDEDEDEDLGDELVIEMDSVEEEEAGNLPELEEDPEDALMEENGSEELYWDIDQGWHTKNYDHDDSDSDSDHNAPAPPAPEAYARLGRDRVEQKLRQKIVVEQFQGEAGAILSDEEAQQDYGYTRYAVGSDEKNPYSPFVSDLDWHIAQWMKLRGPGLNASNEFLKIPGVVDRLQLSFKTMRELNNIIDTKLPNSRPSFQRAKVKVQNENFDVYYRDILQCIQALYGHPQFAQHLIFVPERHYTDLNKTSRLYHEMHTGNWWWATQAELEKDKPGATIIPIIISSDKTQVTTWGGKSVYPVYLTIGNLPKEIRRKPSYGGQILLAYLPTTRLEHITNNSARRRIILNIMHKCLGKIFEPLKKAGKDGLPMASGDGVLRRGHPLYAAHSGDYLEHIAVVGCKMGECPECEAPPKQLGDFHSWPRRQLEKVLNALHTFDDDPMNFFKRCKEAKVKPIISPFWDGLPYCNVYNCITPDILHQLLQGMIKHLTHWIQQAFPKDELDQRCRQMPLNSHVHYFQNGITSLSKITGKEHNDIARILLGLIIDLDLPNDIDTTRLVKATRALLDFLFLAQYPVHSTETLNELQAALQAFHDNKDIFIELGIRNNFNLPKLHFLSHYIQLIKFLGTPDNFNTEYAERLHIDMAKDAFAATNRKEELPQMTTWLERKEKVMQFGEYIEWRLKGCPPITMSSIPYPKHRITMTAQPSRKSVSLQEISTEYHAKYFTDALTRYIAKHNNIHMTPEEVEEESIHIDLPFNSLPVYHKAKFWLGHSEHHPLSSNEYSIAHAKPQTKRKNGDLLAERFDTVLINTMKDSSSYIQNHEVAQLRVIFTIPDTHLKDLFTSRRPVPQYFAYIERFQPFDTKPCGPHGLYQVRRATDDNGEHIASIIAIGNIDRSVHLYPSFGPVSDPSWTFENVLDHCSTFYLNTFSDRHIYHHFA